MLKLFCLSFWAYVSVVMLCNSGDEVESRYEEVDIFFLCDWHLFSERTKRMLPIVIMNSQLPVSIQAFGNISCSRETCKRVYSLHIRITNFTPCAYLDLSIVSDIEERIITIYDISPVFIKAKCYVNDYRP